jgi:hypothetical protein
MRCYYIKYIISIFIIIVSVKIASAAYQVMSGAIEASAAEVRRVAMSLSSRRSAKTSTSLRLEVYVRQTTLRTLEEISAGN